MNKNLLAILITLGIALYAYNKTSSRILEEPVIVDEVTANETCT